RNGLKVNSVLILPSNSSVNSGATTNNLREHKVKKKETLYGIAQIYNVSVDDIKKLNKELYSRSLKKGEILIIPSVSETSEIPRPRHLLPGTQEYTVKPQETKFGIARKFGVSIAEPEDLNPDMGESLNSGQPLSVPD